MEKLAIAENSDLVFCYHYIRSARQLFYSSSDSRCLYARGPFSAGSLAGSLPLDIAHYPDPPFWGHCIAHDPSSFCVPPACSTIFFANCRNCFAVSSSIGTSCSICPAIIAVTSSMESGFCFCSASAASMTWNIAAVTAPAVPNCQYLLNIPQDSQENIFIFSISASCSPSFGRSKTVPTLLLLGVPSIESDRKAIAISISWLRAIIPSPPYLGSKPGSDGLTGKTLVFQ